MASENSFNDSKMSNIRVIHKCSENCR